MRRTLGSLQNQQECWRTRTGQWIKKQRKVSNRSRGQIIFQLNAGEPWTLPVTKHEL